LPLEALGPLVQMAALHLDDAARCGDRSSTCQQQHGTCPLGQTSRYAWSPQQAVEFFPLFGRHQNDSLPWLCHLNVLAQKNLIFACLVSRS